MTEVAPVIKKSNLIVGDIAKKLLALYRPLGLDFGEVDLWSPPFHCSAGNGHRFVLDLDTRAFAATWDEGWPASPGGGMGALGLGLSSREAVDDLHGRVVTADFRRRSFPRESVGRNGGGPAR
jgi:hypothetical protein